MIRSDRFDLRAPQNYTGTTSTDRLKGVENRL